LDARGFELHKEVTSLREHIIRTSFLDIENSLEMWNSLEMGFIA
jgi:hypothetical protein